MGVGACARTGLSVCAAAGVVGCDVLPGSPTDEVCNGVDDDCRDDVDEGFAPLSCGVGACAVTPPSCVGGTLAMCTPGPPGVETCNRIDDDCNGIVDDGAGCDIAEISAG